MTAQANASRDFAFLEADPVSVAQRLLGCVLVREIDDHILRGRIVETEAYHQTDAASHSYKGKTPRTEIMFGPPGRIYVYFTYGMHYCMNVVTGLTGEGSAVLIRALEPLDGVEYMTERRRNKALRELTNGPAKICQAFGIDMNMNGHNLHSPPLYLQLEDPLPNSKIVAATRVGITKDAHRLWRFYERGNDFVSKLA